MKTNNDPQFTSLFQSRLVFDSIISRVSLQAPSVWMFSFCSVTILCMLVSFIVPNAGREIEANPRTGSDRYSTWEVSYEGTKGWITTNEGYFLDYNINSLGFGDFNGDGKSDVFVTDDNFHGWVSYSGTEAWMKINNSSWLPGLMAFEDFNGDGITDLFRTNAGQWQVSYGGTENWTKLSSSNIGLKKLAFGDFNGDGKTDIFRADSDRATWWVSYGGTGSWTKLNSSGVGLESLAFGDFNGDGKTDIFRSDPDKGTWWVSYSGTGGWTKLNSSGVGLKSLAFSDFNGDKKTDIFRADSDRATWWVSYGGTGGWIKLNTSRAGLSELAFRDFDGDGKTDIFKTGLPDRPDSPKYLEITGITSNSISLTWQDQSANEDGFEITYTGKRTGYVSDDDQLTVSKNISSHTVVNLNDGYEYCFKIRAFNKGGYSFYGDSQHNCETIPEKAQPPGPTGYSSLSIFNCHGDRRNVYIWTFDHNTNIWKEYGGLRAQWDEQGANCPGNALPFKVALIDGHTYDLVAVDRQLGGCGGRNDPNRSACQKLLSKNIIADDNGPVLELLVD